MQRHITAELVRWKDSPMRMPLMLRGARQIGKTYTVEAFAKQHFKQLITINFELEPRYKACFNDLHPRAILEKISGLAGQAIVGGEALLFLDEIQECPEAIQALRYFKEQMPELHVIAAGSLLEFSLQDSDFRMPVGRVEFLHMYPLSLQEFFQALGEAPLLAAIENADLEQPLAEVLHLKALDLTRLYMQLGGMPAVINTYLLTKDLSACQRMQMQLLNTFRHDFGKYKPAVKPEICAEFFDKAAYLIAKQFKYVDVDPDRPSRDLKPALKAMQAAQLYQAVYAAKAQGLPLNANFNIKHFKLLFVDIGLVQSMGNLQEELLLTDDLMLLHRGALAEQFVGQELLAYQPAYRAGELCFWKRDKKGASAEVDYLYAHAQNIYPIEVKAGKTGRLKSMHVYLQELKRAPFGIKVSTQALSFDGQALSLPLYMLAHLNKFL